MGGAGDKKGADGRAKAFSSFVCGETVNATAPLDDEEEINRDRKIGLVGHAIKGCMYLPEAALLRGRDSEVDLKVGERIGRDGELKKIHSKGKQKPTKTGRIQESHTISVSRIFDKNSTYLREFVTDWLSDLHMNSTIRKYIQDQDAENLAGANDTTKTPEVGRKSTDSGKSHNSWFGSKPDKGKKEELFSTILSERMTRENFENDLKSNVQTGDVIFFSDSYGTTYDSFGIVFRPFDVQPLNAAINAAESENKHDPFLVKVSAKQSKTDKFWNDVEKNWTKFSSTFAEKLALPLVHKSFIKKFLTAHTFNKVDQWVEGVVVKQVSEPPMLLFELTPQRSNAAVGCSSDGMPLKGGIHLVHLRPRVELFMDPEIHRSTAVKRQMGIVRCTSPYLFEMFSENIVCKLSDQKTGAQLEPKKGASEDSYVRLQYVQRVRYVENQFRDGCQLIRKMSPGERDSKANHPEFILGFWVFVNLSAHAITSVNWGTSDFDFGAYVTDIYSKQRDATENEEEYGDQQKSCIAQYLKFVKVVRSHDDTKKLTISVSRDDTASVQIDITEQNAQLDVIKNLYDVLLPKGNGTVSTDGDESLNKIAHPLAKLMQSGKGGAQDDPRCFVIKHKTQPKTVSVTTVGEADPNNAGVEQGNVAVVNSAVTEAAAVPTLAMLPAAATEELEVVNELALSKATAMKERLESVRAKKKEEARERWKHTVQMAKNGMLYFLYEPLAYVGIGYPGVGIILSVVEGFLSARIKEYHNLTPKERRAQQTIEKVFHIMPWFVLLNTPLRWIYPLGVLFDMCISVVLLAVVGFSVITIRKDTIATKSAEKYMMVWAAFTIMLSPLTPWYLAWLIWAPWMAMNGIIVGFVLGVERGFLKWPGMKEPSSLGNVPEEELKKNKTLADKMKVEQQFRVKAIRDHGLFVYPWSNFDRLVPLPIDTKTPLKLSTEEKKQAETQIQHNAKTTAQSVVLYDGP